MAGKEIGPLSWVLDKKQLAIMLEAIAGSERVVIDLETTGLDEHAVTGGVSNGGVAARVVMASLTLPQRAHFGDPTSEWDGVDPTTYIVPLSHPSGPFLGQWRKVLKLIMQTVAKYKRPLENQNLKFDSKWWKATTGVSTEHLIVWDTQISSHLLDENSSTRLKERAPAELGIERWDDDVNFTKPGAAEHHDMWVLGEYAARDTYWVWRLGKRHRERMFLEGEDGAPESAEEIEDARLGVLATWVAMPTVASLTRMEQRGILLDVPWVKEHLKTDEETAAEHLETLAERFNMPRDGASMAPTSKWFAELTNRAVENKDLHIGAVTKTGKPQWSKSVLKRQSREGLEVAQLILDQRQASKRAEFLRAWLEVVTPAGTIHTTYNSGRVVTGRLSSSGPNMQQVTKSLRPAFIPRDGYYMVDLDYSQIELRVAAFIARCMPMLEAFREGKDLHRMLAGKVVGKDDLSLVTPEERQSGKSANFGLLYGMSAHGYQIYAEDAYGVHLTELEAVQFHQGFFDLWVGLSEWHERTKARAHATGKIISPLGRVRRLPGIFDSNPAMVSFSERAAVNSPVQGMASDLMQTAAASIQGLLPGSAGIDGIHLVGTVHDSIIAEVRQDGWEDLVAQAQERMTQLDRVLARMGVDLDVPLVADATVGTRWGLSDIQEG